MNTLSVNVWNQHVCDASLLQKDSCSNKNDLWSVFAVETMGST